MALVESFTVKHSPELASLEGRYELPFAPPGVYSARKHQVPVLLTVTAAESACEAGGFEPATGLVVTGEPTAVPFGLGQAPPLVCVGSQMKNDTLPVGVPAPPVVAVTTAWSVTELPKTAVPPEPAEGVVTVVVGIFATLKHSSAASAVSGLV